MTIYDISNPSDPYTIVGDFIPCAAAVLCIGGGKMGLHPLGTGEGMPIFLLGGADQWLESKGMVPFDDWLTKHALEVAEALDTVLIGRPSERETLEAVFAGIADKTERSKARATYHDRTRTSMNDIGSRAALYAKRLRELAKPTEVVHRDGDQTNNEIERRGSSGGKTAK